VAVLDGHRGYDAAGAAAGVLAAAAPDLVGADPVDRRQVEAVLTAARAAVADAVAAAGGERAGSRTALTLALARDGRLLHATCGDTSLLLVSGRRGAAVSRDAPFLGPDTPLPRVASGRLRPGDRLVALTDGFTTFAGARWPALATDRAAGLPAEDACLELITAAGELGAGDNVAAAVLDA